MNNRDLIENKYVVTCFNGRFKGRVNMKDIKITLDDKFFCKGYPVVILNKSQWEQFLGNNLRVDEVDKIYNAPPLAEFVEWFKFRLSIPSNRSTTLFSTSKNYEKKKEPLLQNEKDNESDLMIIDLDDHKPDVEIPNEKKINIFDYNLIKARNSGDVEEFIKSLRDEGFERYRTLNYQNNFEIRPCHSTHVLLSLGGEFSDGKDRIFGKNKPLFDFVASGG
eukprot:TRINITY_DN2475_c0_g3_i1.p1 TRINITY_DN2475_c0_g3~~TRINITY_DN2475_c0_g3_i1.p1  ORF type:complete len:221 (+),score=54.50 TRINITY_DN2475_c0_g3_i1:84-746(+)